MSTSQANRNRPVQSRAVCLAVLIESALLSFDLVRTGRPVRLQAFHGTMAAKQAIMRRGFRIPKEPVNAITNDVRQRLNRRDPRDNALVLGRGVYFVDDKNAATQWGMVVPVIVTLQKPFVIQRADLDDLLRVDPSDLRDEGYDGIIVQSGRYGGRGSGSTRQGVAFYPTSVAVVKTQRTHAH